MRKIVLAALALVALAGCNANTAATIQADAKQICGFLPTAAAVGQIINVSTKVQTAEQIAQAICSAVVPVSEARTFGAAARAPVGKTITVTVDGVKVTGHFVR